MKKFVRTHGKLLIGAAIIVVLLLVWGWFAGSARQQTSFHRTDDRVNQVEKLLSDVYTGNRAERVAAIGSLARLEQKDICHADWWNDWQQSVVPTVKTEAERCRTKEKNLSKVIRAADAIQQHLAAEIKVTTQLNALTIDSSVKDWPTKAKTAAEGAVKVLDGIRVVSSVEPVKTAAKTRIEAIVAGWTSLNAASGKQDKDAYLTAEAQLKQAYANLAAIADISDAELQKLLGVLMSTSKAL